MSSNEKAVMENYWDGAEDQRASRSRSAELEFYYTKKHISPYLHPNDAVIELGCGTGYYAMCFADRCETYLGVDLLPAHIDLFRKKIRRSGLPNVQAKIGDATDLRELPSGRFDVVLCLGPLYHLPPEERELCFAECRRICRDGGTAAFAYINKAGVYAGGCVHDRLREFYPNDKANEYILRLGRDDLKPDVFFFTMPEEMEEAAKRHGFSKIQNLGVDFFITAGAVDTMDDEKFEKMRPLLDYMTSYESCTGMSNHALLICKKETL